MFGSATHVLGTPYAPGTPLATVADAVASPYSTLGWDSEHETWDRPNYSRRMQSRVMRAAEGAIQRRAVMEAAREREQARRDSVRASLPPCDIDMPVTVAHIGIGCATRMQAMECRYRQLRDSKRLIESVMQCEPHNEGRGQVTRATDSVNGTEVRAGRRWHSTPLNKVTGVNGEPIDRTAYRVTMQPLATAGYRVTREPIASGATAKRRKRAAKVTSAGHAATYQARVAAFGAVGSGD